MLQPAAMGGEAASGTALSRALRRVAEAVGVRPEETGPLVAACLFQASFVGGVAILKASSNALLLSTTIATTLPLLYVGSSLITGGVVAYVAVSRAPRRWPPTATFALWVVAILGLAALAHLGVPHAVDLLYLAIEVYATTVSVRFWARVGDLFDVRESRRLLGLIGGSGMAGSIVGGALTQALGESVGALRLVPAACLSLVGCLIVAPKLLAASPLSERPRTNPNASRIAPKQDVRRYLAGDSLPKAMAIAVALFAVSTALVDFVFRARAKAILPELGAQTALFGGVSAVVGVIAMTVQFAFTAPLLKRIGLFGYLAITPVGVAIFGGLAAMFPGLWPVYGLKTVEQVGSLSLAQTGVQLLYGPMPDWARASARNAIDGFAKKFGYALAGLGLFFVALDFGKGVAGHHSALPWVIAAVAVISLGAISRVRTFYVRTIGRRLSSPAADEPVDDVPIADATSRKVLEEAVQDKDERRVLTALAILARDRTTKIEGVLLPLLEHASPKVRREAARLAGERGCQTCAVKLTELAKSDEPMVREAAIDAVAVLRPFTAARLLAPLLQHPDMTTRSAAIAALVPLDATGQAVQALEELLDIGAAAMPGQRAQVARLLGRLGIGYSKKLIPYLRDPSDLVRKAACEAAGTSGDLDLVHDLFELLVARETRRDARIALEKFGDRILGRIETVLNDKRAPSDLRYRMPRLLREIGTPRALEVILFSNPADDPFLQYRLSDAAARIREAHPEIEYDHPRALEATLRRLDAYHKLLPTSRDLKAALGPNNLLVRAVDGRLDQHLDSAIKLTGLIAPQRPVLNAWNRFRFGEEKARPYAVEMLENLIDSRTLARKLAHALEAWHRRPDWREEGRIESAPAKLLELVATRDVVLKAIAIVTVRKLAEARRAEPLPLAVGQGSGVNALAHLASGQAWDMLLNNPPVIQEEGPVSENIVEKVLFLEGCDIFAESDVDDLAAVAHYVREKTYRAGEPIFQENDPGDALFVIVDGQVSLDKGAKHLFDLGPRHSFGETSLLDNKPRPSSAKALTDVKVLILERADFMDLVSDRVELLRGIFGAITRDLRTVLDAAAAGRITSPSMTPVTLGKATRLKTG